MDAALKSTDPDQLWQAASEGDAEAQYRLGMHYNHQSNFSRGRRWLEKATRQDHPKALTELALVHLHGIGVRPDPQQAAGLLERSSDAEAQLQLATLLWVGFGIARDRQRARKHLLEAAEQRLPAALTTLALCHGMSQATQAQSHASICFQVAAAGGDPMAQLCLARRYAEGLGLSQDQRRADYWLAQAVRSKKLYLPEHPNAALVPTDTPPELPDIEELEPALYWPDITFPRLAQPNPGEIRSTESALSSEVCFYLVNLAAPYLRPSMTVHPETGEAVHNKMRSSSGMSMHPAMEDIVVHLAKDRLAGIAGMTADHAEPFAFLRYRGGEEYREHYDFIDPDSGEARYQLSRLGQRELTVFAYLSNPEGGGQTHFPRIDVTVEPLRGQAVCFRNTQEDGQPDLESLHASLPVTGGEKWLATLWLREKPFQASF